MPFTHIRHALEAYHQQNENPQPLVYNGKTVGNISINESIVTAHFFKDDQLVSSFHGFHREKEIDYAHLEKLQKTSAPDPDRIELEIERNPLSSNSPDKYFYLYLLSYDVKTGESSRKFIDSYITPRR